jgi:6-phosphofructokinase 2
MVARIAKIAVRRNIKLIVDSSGQALKSVEGKCVYLMKPNLAELSELTGKNLTSISDTINAAKETIHNNNVKILVVSLGDKGALLVTANMAKHLPAPKVQVKSTVGAGDSMLAGIVSSLSAGKSIEESVRFGILCGTAATIRPGTLLCDLKTVKLLLSTYQD